MNITEKIERLRVEKGWSVARLAREAEMPTISLRVMLRRYDENNYSIPALQKIAKALDTTVSVLTRERWEDEQKPSLNKAQLTDLNGRVQQLFQEYFTPEKVEEKPKYPDFEDDEEDNKA